MHRYGIGLDLGVASVGWGIVGLDMKDEPIGIIKMGSWIYKPAEVPKTGESLTKFRREKRSQRRTWRRKKHRLERIKGLLVRKKIVTKEKLAKINEGPLEDIYALRVRALDEPVTSQEFARILLHLAKRRGFKITRAAADDEDGVLLVAVDDNSRRMSEAGYRTVAEMYLRDPVYRAHVRNKGYNPGASAQEEKQLGYIGTVSRDMMVDEVSKIFEAQRQFGQEFASKEIEEAYLNIYTSQRNFDEGPGPGSYAYHDDVSMIERRVGMCTLIPDEPRAPKASYAFQMFDLLQNINNIRIRENGTSRALTDHERQAIIAMAKRSDSVKYSQIRKSLKLSEDANFANVFYKDGQSRDESERIARFANMTAYHKVRLAIQKNLGKERWEQVTPEQIDAIAQVLSIWKSEEKIRAALAQEGIDGDLVDAVLHLTFKGFGNISTKACYSLIPYMEQGMTYDKACAAAGFNYLAHGDGQKNKYLKITDQDLADVSSPVVRKTIREAARVINAIVKYMGRPPVYINIELARDIKRSPSERRKIQEEQERNRAANERLKNELSETFGIPLPNGEQVLKYRLYQEQGGISPYSLRSMDLRRVLTDPKYAEVDHIVPYSLSLDDGYHNKVLVLTSDNQDKGQRLPYEFIPEAQYHKYEVWVGASHLSNKKKANLLKREISEDERNDWRRADLQNTQFASTFIRNYLEDNMVFDPFLNGKKQHAFATKGVVTNQIRKRLGIEKIRADGDLHNAVDAILIACTTQGMVTAISKYAASKENHTQHMMPVMARFPEPWPGFRRELDARLDPVNPKKAIEKLNLPFYDGDDAPVVEPIFVARKVEMKHKGQAHLETVASPKALDKGLLVYRVPITNLTIDKATGEIANYHNPQDDIRLYEALKARLKEFGGDGKKAFSEPFYRPGKNGERGPLVKKVKIEKPTSSNVEVYQGNGVAANGDMVRIDVYHIDGEGYYFVPVYVADLIKPEKPMMAPAGRNKPWRNMNPEDFCFSLSSRDLIHIRKRSGITMNACFKDAPPMENITDAYVYFISANISNCAFQIISHDGAYKKEGFGMRSLDLLEKMHVSPLGEITKWDTEH